ncbi:MAG: ATP-binding protein [Nitrospirae bacterium]|nr:ATP-binding protein [Nitrospirota bacterium]
MTDLNILGDRIIHALSHAIATAQGALFILDREHACYRRANMIGADAATLGPATLAGDHPLPRHLLAANRIMARTDAQEDPQETSTDAHAALESLHGAYAVPHLSKGRLIGFSLLGAAAASPEAPAQTQPLLAALAQIATNALDTLILSQDLHRSLGLIKRTDRMKSLETIAGGFAHEIRNPLTSIKTFIQLAPERKDDPDFIQEFSKIVLGDVYRIEHLIQKILDYSRYMEPTLADEDVNDLVASCVHFIDVKADSRKITIEKILAPDLPRVMLDRQQIKQVLINLLINAVDAIGTQGGRLRVQTSKLVKPTGKVWVQIDIEDTGEGIQEDNLEHIFDPFFTTKPETGEHEGTGLGLTIVHQIIQEHHGEIRVKSSVGVGTTFSVCLPVLPA